MKRVHLVCFRLRLHGRTPAAYDVRLVTSRMNQLAILFAHRPDRARSLSPYTFLLALSVTLSPPPRSSYETSEDGRIHASNFSRPTRPAFVFTLLALLPSLRQTKSRSSSALLRFARTRLPLAGFASFLSYDCSTLSLHSFMSFFFYLIRMNYKFFSRLINSKILLSKSLNTQ